MTWSFGDRFDLYASCMMLTAKNITPDEAGMCLHILLDRGEIYIDPTIGINIYTFENEQRLISDLGLKLHRIAGEGFSLKKGASAIAHAEWPEAVNLAQRLLDRMKINGLGPQEIMDAIP